VAFAAPFHIEAIMSKLVITIFFLVISTLTSYAKEPVRTIEGVVSKVSDGDTIQVLDPYGTKVKVRMYGMDAPETEKSNRKTRP